MALTLDRMEVEKGILGIFHSSTKLQDDDVSTTGKSIPGVDRHK